MCDRSVHTVIITDINGNYDKLLPAAACIAKGGLAAFPTETVYGLGANAFDPHGVRKIFQAKGRPNDNPLIIHISDTDTLYKLADEVPDYAKKLITAFWPGPLTLIFKKAPVVGSEVTAGLETVAVRMPAHPAALALIEKAGVPIAAPSANLSGRPSPTRADHVIQDLWGKADYIIDGGDCTVGLESTVLDITVYPPVILRPGGIIPGQIREVAGAVTLHPSLAHTLSPGMGGIETAPRSPGMKYRHYSPKAKFIMLEGERAKVLAAMEEMAQKEASSGSKVGIMCTDELSRHFNKCGYVVKTLGPKDQTEEAASKLFAALRDFDDDNCDIIYSQTFSGSDIGFATMNRLYKVAGDNVIKVF